MDKEKYEKALIDIEDEIKDCSGGVLDSDGKCICTLYPCWVMVAKESIKKQINTQF